MISQMEIIEKLPKQLLEELCRIFKVEEANAPHGLLIQQFKNKMADIFIQEAYFFAHLEMAIWITCSYQSSGHSVRTSPRRCISSSSACGTSTRSTDNASRSISLRRRYKKSRHRLIVQIRWSSSTLSFCRCIEMRRFAHEITDSMSRLTRKQRSLRLRKSIIFCFRIQLWHR